MLISLAVILHSVGLGAFKGVVLCFVIFRRFDSINGGGLGTSKRVGTVE